MAALQKQLEDFQKEAKLRQAKEAEVQVLKSQLEELQAKEADEEQKVAAAAAAVAAAVVPSGSPKKKSNKYKEEIERLRARISQMKMEAIGDYEYMMMQVWEWYVAGVGQRFYIPRSF